MSFSYSWQLTKVYRTVPEGIITQTFWRCTAVDEDGKTAIMDGGTVFDQYAVKNNEPEPLTGKRPAFIEDPSDEEILSWIIEVHTNENRLSALEALFKVKLYGDADDLTSPPPDREEDE